MSVVLDEASRRSRARRSPAAQPHRDHYGSRVPDCGSAGRRRAAKYIGSRGRGRQLLEPARQVQYTASDLLNTVLPSLPCRGSSQDDIGDSDAGLAVLASCAGAGTKRFIATSRRATWPSIRKAILECFGVPTSPATSRGQRGYREELRHGSRRSPRVSEFTCRRSRRRRPPALLGHFRSARTRAPTRSSHSATPYNVLRLKTNKRVHLVRTTTRQRSTALTRARRRSSRFPSDSTSPAPETTPYPVLGPGQLGRRLGSEREPDTSRRLSIERQPPCFVKDEREDQVVCG